MTTAPLAAASTSTDFLRPLFGAIDLGLQLFQRLRRPVLPGIANRQSVSLGLDGDESYDIRIEIRELGAPA